MKIASSQIEATSSMQYQRSEISAQSVRFQLTTPQSEPVEEIKEAELSPKMRRAAQVLEALMGKKIHLNSMHENNRSQGNHYGWGMEISNSYSLHEAQSLEINTAGRVTTEDGRQIDFSLNMQFYREFSMTSSTVIRAGDPLTDPLVISMDGNAPIGEGRFAFDLNRGGEVEYIPNLSSNSGFLTLDKNNDGKINDGTELFGPQSGNGFDELAAYDEDNNGWIDENDSVYKSLKLWIKTAEDDKTITLQEAGIGALSLSAIEGSFDFKDSENNTLAQIQNSSVALTESGEAKAIFGLNVAT